ncbi:MAG: carbohydrate ABC transporter permease [Candidatus Flexifilum sp.]|jgi:ABC-type glycerol-3-phosphate transport system permease component
MTGNRSPGIWLARAVLAGASLLVLLPLIYQVGISFKPPAQIFENVLTPFPLQPTLDNYAAVLNTVPMLSYLGNSIAFAAGVSIGQIILAVPAAFAFSFFRFPLRGLLLGLVILSLIVPFVVTYVPNYLFLAQFKLINTLPGLILPMLGVSLGFGIFLLRQHFLSFQKEVMEAALIDGANSLQVLLYVVAPANRSAITALLIYIFINTWNQFIWPLLIGGGREEAYTLTVGVQMYFTNPEGGNRWGSVMAASVLTALPTFIVYLLMRRGILRTFTEGAVKG